MKKLKLNKKTIESLSESQLEGVKGGTNYCNDPTVTCPPGGDDDDDTGGGTGNQYCDPTLVGSTGTTTLHRPTKIGC